MLRIHLTIANFRKIKMVGGLLRNTTLESVEHRTLCENSTAKAKHDKA